MSTRRSSLLAVGLLCLTPCVVWAQSGLPSPSEPSPTPQPGPQPGPAPTTPKPTPSPNSKGSEPKPKPEAPGLVDLRPKFKVGQVRRLKMENISLSKMPKVKLPGLDEDPAPSKPTGPSTPKPSSKPAPGGKPNTPAKPDDTTTSSFTNEFTLVFAPTAVDESGTATVDVTFETIKAKIESDFANDSFDSTKPPPKKKPSSNPLGDVGETPLLEETLRPLVGEKLTLTVDREGNITNVTGGDKFAALFQSASQAGSPGTSPAGSSPASSLFGPIFTAAKSKGKAAVGESWTLKDKLSLSMLGEVSMETRHTLKSHAAARALVEYVGVLQPNSAAPDPSKPFNLRSCEHKGSYLWNTDDGFVESMTNSMIMKTDFNLAGTNGTAESTQTTTISRIR